MNPYMQFPLISSNLDARASHGTARPADPIDELLSINGYRSITAIESLAGRAAKAVRRTVAGVRARRRRRAAIDELMALDDRALKDIGLHRSEIESAVDDLLVSGPASSARRQSRPAESFFTTLPAPRVAANDAKARKAA